MATVYAVNQGELDVLDVYIGAAALRVGLFKNNATVNDATVLGDLTPADFSGYSVWTPSYGAAATVSNQGKASAGSHNFDHNGGGTANTIYGAYLFNNTTSKLIKVVKFDSPITMDDASDRITITENLKLAGTI